MTPREKAVELIEKFDTTPNKCVLYLSSDEIFESCKQGAINCVNEIIQECQPLRIEYWTMVKQEIENG